MRILMVSDVPLRPELGAGRPQFELVRELTRLGHVVETFDRVDAFGDDRRTFTDRFRPLRFARQARRHVRTHAARFDVVDANQGNLPFRRRTLQFDGVVVARSAGLFAFYREYRRRERALWSHRLPGTRLGQLVSRWRDERTFAAERISFRECDLALFPNVEEEAYARENVRPGRPSATIPLALSDDIAEALAAAARPAAERLAARRVAFIGSWTLRKGIGDWPAIVDAVRRAVPDATFLFLGTGASRETVVRDVGCDDVEVVPYYDAETLPALLGAVTVGAVTSYVEAGPFSVLEFQGAGIPTVAYDAIGARSLIAAPDLLVPLGDAGAFADRVARLLVAQEQEYDERSREAAAAAAGYRWRDVAERTVSAYERASSERRR